MTTAEDALVGYITSDIIDDVFEQLDEPLIPCYLKTTSEGFLTAAYAYNGETVRGFVCSPAGGIWRPAGAFEPTNPVLVRGNGTDTRFIFFGKDSRRAEQLEQDVFDELDDIYEYSVTETSLFDAQLEIARDKCSCTDTERVTLTLPLVEDTNVYPVVCKQCMRVHAVSEEGKKRTVEAVLERATTSPVSRASTFDSEVVVGVLWYQQYRDAPSDVVSLRGTRKWIVGNGETAVGYILSRQEDDMRVLADTFVSEGNRGNGWMTAALQEWVTSVDEEPVLCEMTDDCVSFVEDAIPDRRTVKVQQLAGFELGQERLSSEDDD